MEEARDVLAEAPGGPREEQFVAVGDMIDTSGLDGFLRCDLFLESAESCLDAINNLTPHLPHAPI